MPMQTDEALIRVTRAHLQSVPEDDLQDEIIHIVAGLLYMAKGQGFAITTVAQRAALMAANAGGAHGA